MGIIHHHDKQRWNNHPHNLELFTSNKLHMKERHYPQDRILWWDKKWREKKKGAMKNEEMRLVW